MIETAADPSARRLAAAFGRQLALLWRCGLALLMVLGLAAALMGQRAATGSAVVEDTIWHELEGIERSTYARPLAQLEALQALQARTAPGSPERLEVLSLRGVMVARMRDRSLSDALLAELRAWPVAQSRDAAEVVATMVTARYELEQGDVSSAKKALLVLTPQRLQKLPDRIHQRAETTRARVLAEAGDLDAALLASQSALRLADVLNAHWRRALALTEMAMTHFRAQQTERARQTAQRALDEARRDPDPETLYMTLTVYGIVHAEHPDIRITQQAYVEALKQAEDAGALSMQALGLGNFADYHLRRGEFAQALRLAEQALPLARRTQHVNAEVLALHNMGIAKIGLKRLAEGTRDVRQAIKLDQDQGSLSNAAEGWAELGRYLESAGDWDGAIDAFHQYRRLIDSVLRDETRKAVLEAQESFDAERRAKEIELLERDNSLKSEQIRARDLQLRLWSAVAGCIVVSSVLLVLAYRRMRRSNVALARVNEDLKLQSERDPLTGLANRRYFHATIERMEAEAGQLSATVYLIDIDLFKRINDQHGHAAGDSVLIEVAARLRTALREHDLVVRWGGEEFLIVVPERDPVDAQALAQRLLDIIGTEPVRHGDAHIAITASIGFASFPVPSQALTLSWERAIDLVDTVMYMAKAHGRNRAYGVQRADVADELGLQALMPRMEAAWRSGQVGLVSLHGPQSAQEAAA